MFWGAYIIAELLVAREEVYCSVIEAISLKIEQSASLSTVSKTGYSLS